MASLKQLLAEEGFKHKKFLESRRHVKVGDRRRPEEPGSMAVPVSHKKKSFDCTKQKSDRGSTRKGLSNRVSSDGETSNSKSIVTGDEPDMDDAAIKAVVSMLSGYIGRYIKDVGFREIIKEKCNSCLIRRTKDSDSGVLANIELGIESIEKLIINDQGTRTKLLRNSIQLLSSVASLNCNESRNGSTCGVPNSHLSACSQLYLSIVYKLEKNDRISARHLLQVFCDSAFLARNHLLPDLWENFFLSHLLHLKVWYHEELEFLAGSQHVEMEKRMKALSKVYNDQMDMGTIQFALYYKEWLKVGGKAPSLPSVPLPSRPSYLQPRRRSSDSCTSNSSANRNLYRTVFGPAFENGSEDLDSQTKASTGTSVMEDESLFTEEDGRSQHKYTYKNARTSQRRRHLNKDFRSSGRELWPLSNVPTFKLFTCRSALSECIVNGNLAVKNTSAKKEEKTSPPSDDLGKAISTICTSESIADCEVAIRIVTKIWLDSQGDPVIEGALSKAPVLEWMLEILFASEDDEILELIISMLAEFAVRKEATRRIVLNYDPQLEIFTKLLKSSTLFLKSAVLLYLLKPKAKQMISMDWVMLALRVLEFRDQLQTLLTVRCKPQKAAMYLLDQLLTGFSEDKNLENASQVVSLGGLSMLVRSFKIEDVNEREDVAKLMSCCIRADATARTYLAENLNKASLLELIVHGIQHKSKGFALDLLSELLCLSRRTQIIKFLNGLRDGWDGLSAMHIFVAYFQRASPKERPLVAAILLQIDVLGDPLKFSVIREEAIEAIIEALDSQKCNPKVQEQSARALLMLGCRSSCSGESTGEDWLLQQSGFLEISMTPFSGKQIVNRNLNEADEANEDWLRKVAVVLLNSGGKRFLTALSNSIANGIPSLAQASLFTVAWMNRILLSVGNRDFQYMAHSILVPELKESLHCERAIYGSLQDVIKSPECVSMLSTLDEELIDPLRNPL